MREQYPHIACNLQNLMENYGRIRNLLSKHAIEMAVVTKCISANDVIVSELAKNGAGLFCDSRHALYSSTTPAVPRTQRMHIGPLSLSECDRAAARYSVTQHSTKSTLQAIEYHAARRKEKHSVMIHVDFGDSREGAAKDVAVQLIGYVLQSDWLALHGLSTNFNCRTRFAPGQVEADQISDFVDWVDNHFGISTNVVSGGNSSSLGWLIDGGAPRRINQLRIGEALFLGTDPVDGQPVAGLRSDVFSMNAEVVFVRISGRRRLCVFRFGYLDTDPRELTAPAGFELEDFSSDYTVFSTSNMDIRDGAVVRFGLHYKSLQLASCSRFVALRFQ